MKILVADDDELTRKSLALMLGHWGLNVITAANGQAAWDVLNSNEPPRIALVDRMMPEMDGIEICRRVRATDSLKTMHIILLTALKSTQDIVDGLEAGANDYMIKPFEQEELRVRINVGIRMVKLQDELTNRVKELEAALAHVKQLQGLLPICASCKKIRDQENYWHMVEDYIGAHSEAKFTHGYCPDCFNKFMAELETQEFPSIVK